MDLGLRVQQSPKEPPADGVDRGTLPLCSREGLSPQDSRLSQSVRASVTKYHNLSGITNGPFVSHGSGSYKSKIKVWAGLLPSECWKEESASCLSPSLWWLCL